MFEFIIQNIGTIVVSLIVIGIITAIILNIIKQKKKGKCSCCDCCCSKKTDCDN